jgi:hypothetical protein
MNVLYLGSMDYYIFSKKSEMVLEILFGLLSLSFNGSSSPFRAQASYSIP